MSKQKEINHEFLMSHGFAEPQRWYDEKWEQFRLNYSIEGYDCTILLSPSPQTVGEMTAQEQVESFSEIDVLKNHHIGDYHVYVNSTENHVATFQFKQDLFLFMEICKVPLKQSKQ